MKINYKINLKFPALAWIAKICSGEAAVIAGSKVETKDNFFVEGAWGGGDFLNANFDNAEWFCGTGGVVRDNKIVFSTPTGMHAGLFIVQKENSVVISNSLCLLMASEGYGFDPQFIGYETYFNYNILQGINSYNPVVHTINADGTNADTCVHMILFRNITVCDDGTVSIDIKPNTKGFDSFEEYYERLVQTMKSMAQNAKDEHRIQKYDVTSFISSGYDAAACAAVAKEAGAKKALTFEAKGKYTYDSGIGATKYLGYETVVERDACAYMRRSDFPEIQSISGGDIGNVISFSAFEEDMKGHLVFSGENGDFVWNKNKSFQTINDEIHIVWKNSEIGLSESHLHQEYIPVPMTSFGIRHWPDLYKISNSNEMAAWSLGNDYDRPIPRRILEKKGLPRDSFGMKKYGAGFFYAYDWKKRILSRMSDTSARDFEQYIKAHKKLPPIGLYAKFLWVHKANYFNAAMSKLHLHCRIAISDSKIERRNAVSNPFAARYLIPWAGERMIDEYKQALEERTP